MKVGIVNFNSFNCQQSSNVAIQSSQNKTFWQSLVKTPTSFEGGKLPFYKRNGIPCPCCGKIMIPHSRFLKELTDGILSGWGKDSVKVLLKFKQYMPKIEKSCFEKIQNESKKHPEKTLNQILRSFRKKSKKNLNKNQFDVLGEISQLGRELSIESAQKINTLTHRARIIIIEDRPGNFFKRKVFINDILELIKELPEKNIIRKIYKKSQELNSSESDLDAFIVKYSQRCSSEIGQRLVSKSVSTIEHIKPKANDGENCLENYLLECAGCNNSRGDTPLDEWIKNRHPEMLRNAQKHINVVIDLINKGIIRNFDFYPTVVAQTLETESKGLIQLDLSNLKQYYQKAS